MDNPVTASDIASQLVSDWEAAAGDMAMGAAEQPACYDDWGRKASELRQKLVQSAHEMGDPAPGKVELKMDVASMLADSFYESVDDCQGFVGDRLCDATLADKGLRDAVITELASNGGHWAAVAAGLRA